MSYAYYVRVERAMCYFNTCSTPAVPQGRKDVLRLLGGLQSPRVQFPCDCMMLIILPTYF